MNGWKEGQVLRLEITGYAADGAGVARQEGVVIFVKGALRGETCDVVLEKVGRSAVWGRAVKVLVPSPARMESDCPYYETCGGCQLRHMTYSEELALKRGRVEDALRRIGGLDLGVSVILGSENTKRYRNKVQFPVSDRCGVKAGFYRQRSHHVIDVEDCLLQPEAATRLRSAAKAWMERYGVSAYDERTFKGLVRHFYVRTNAEGESLFCLLVNGKKVPHEEELVEALRAAEPGLAGVVLGVNEKKNNVILGESYRTLWGEETLTDTLCGLTFRLSVPSFYQVNAPQAQVLYEQALDFAALTGKETVLDLYCGIGTISLVMAKRAGEVIGAEVVPQAVDNARENALRNSVQNASFLCADAGEAAQTLAEQGKRPDVICVDPPRKGLSLQVIDAIAAMAPRRLIYVSCDPGTLGRDLKELTARGFTAEKAAAVDLFPRTAHVETVCLLSKLNAKQHIEINLDMDELDLTDAEKKATYQEIKDYVLEHSGLKVSSLYIAQVKQKCGIIERENYNKPKSEDAKQPQCPPDKEKAIKEALTHFGMI